MSEIIIKVKIDEVTGKIGYGVAREKSDKSGIEKTLEFIGILDFIKSKQLAKLQTLAKVEKK